MAMENILKALREAKRSVVDIYSMVDFSRDDLDKVYTRLMVPLRMGNVQKFDEAYGYVLETPAGNSLIDALCDQLCVDSHEELMEKVKNDQISV